MTISQQNRGLDAPPADETGRAVERLTSAAEGLKLIGEGRIGNDIHLILSYVSRLESLLVSQSASPPLHQDKVPDLSEPYVPTLLAFDDPPRAEYINADVPSISRRVDERLDLLLDVETREPIGFRLYGRWQQALSGGGEAKPKSETDNEATRRQSTNVRYYGLADGERSEVRSELKDLPSRQSGGEG